METIMRAGIVAGAVLLGCGAVQADDYDWEDIFAPYRQRIDTATTESGNAQNVNAATQVITPWPRNVFNRRIQGDGARMVDAIKNYREPHAQSGPAPSRPLTRPAPAAGGAGPLGGAGTAPTGEVAQPESLAQ